MSQIPKHSSKWDIFAVDNLFYIVRNDTSPPLHLRAESLRKATNYYIDVLPPLMAGGDHYFGTNGNRYRILGNQLRSVSDLSDESGEFIDQTIDDSSLGGEHYFCRHSDENYVHRVSRVKKSGMFVYSDVVYKTIKNFLAGKKYKTVEATPVKWEVKAFWANGNDFYCLADDGDNVVRRKATSFSALFGNSALTTGMSSEIVTFLPGGFVNSQSFIQGDWELFAFFEGGPYDQEVSTEVGVYSKQVEELSAHWEVTQSTTAKVTSKGAMSAVAEASVESTTTSTMGASIKSTFSESSSEVTTVTKRFKGPVSDKPDDYYWTFVVKQKGKSSLSKGLGQAITHTNTPPPNPWLASDD